MGSQSWSGGTRMASAQPPANAAPNTSAPIRIAAEMTVMTLGQTIWREAVEGACVLILCSCCGPQSLRKGRLLQAQKAQKCRIACYRIPRKFTAKTGFCDVGHQCENGPLERGREPASRALADAVRDPAFRGDQARALHAG